MSKRVIGKPFGERLVNVDVSSEWLLRETRHLLILSVISCGALGCCGLRTGWHAVRHSAWVLAFSSPVKYCLGQLLDPFEVKSHMSCVSTQAPIHSFYHTTQLCQYSIIYMSRYVIHFDTTLDKAPWPRYARTRAHCLSFSCQYLLLLLLSFISSITLYFFSDLCVLALC